MFAFKNLSLAFIVFAGVVGCQTSPFRNSEHFVGQTHEGCTKIMRKADWNSEVSLLSTVQKLYDDRCDAETLRLGDLLRSSLRDKNYSLTAELASLLIPERMTTTYVLESHERVYLSILMAMSAMRLNDRDAALVELRRASDEMNAEIYNFGEDKVNSALIAALFVEAGEPGLADPFWRKAGLVPSSKSSSWKIYAVGQMDGYNWSVGFNKGFYDIQSKTQLPHQCVSNTGALIPVNDWVHKMKIKHHTNYHPLLHLKSWVRLPIGLTYGGIMITSGVTVGLGGCIAAAKAGNQDAGENICAASLQLGSWLWNQAPGVFDYAAAPDLRHWPSSPAGFIVTNADSLYSESCFAGLDTTTRRIW